MADLRTMVFIDGPFLGEARREMRARNRQPLELDFKRFPLAVGECLTKTWARGISVQRTLVAGFRPTNVSLSDKLTVAQIHRVYERMCGAGYGLLMHAVDFGGRRLSGWDRYAESAGRDHWEPNTKEPQVQLICEALRLAALRSCDVAVFVAAERCFIPALRAVADFGARPVLVGTQSSLENLHDELHAIGVLTLALDEPDFIRTVTYPPRRIQCQDPQHRGSQPAQTHVPDGAYCDACRAIRARERRAMGGRVAGIIRMISPASEDDFAVGKEISGVVANKRDSLAWVRVPMQGGREQTVQIAKDRSLAQGTEWKALEPGTVLSLVSKRLTSGVWGAAEVKIALSPDIPPSFGELPPEEGLGEEAADLDDVAGFSTNDVVEDASGKGSPPTGPQDPAPPDDPSLK